MMLLDLLIDIVINIYTSLGYGTKEHKIESKMEKLKHDYPLIYDIYLKNKTLFETDSELSNIILKLKIKNSESLKNTVEEICMRFKILL